MLMFKASDPLTEQIAQYLGHQIVTGQLKAGERIQELRIAGELEVSRGSVREALLIMQRRHLIDILPRRGAVVASLSEDDVRALYELWFFLLEKLAIKLCSHWQADELAPYIDLIDGLQQQAEQGSVEKFYETAARLVTGLYDYAGNRFMQQVLDDLLPVARRTSFLVLESGRGELEKTHAFFQALLKSVQARDEAACVATLRDFGHYHCELALAAVRQQAATA